MKKSIITLLVILAVFGVKANAAKVVTENGIIREKSNTYFSLTRIFKKSNLNIIYDGSKYIGATPKNQEIILTADGTVYLNGKKINIKTVVKDNDIYAYYKSFRKIGFTVDKYNKRYYVILPYVFENHLIYSELYNTANDIYKEMYIEQDLWDRFVKSMKFKKVNKNTLRTPNRKIKIVRPEMYTEEYMTSREREDIYFYIKERNFKLKNRRVLKKYLSISFPDKYRKVYKIFNKVIRQEKWQDNDGFTGHPSYNSFYSKRKFLNKRGFSAKYYRLYNGKSYATLSVSRYMTEYKTHLKYENNISSLWKKRDHLYKKNIKKYKLNKR